MSFEDLGDAAPPVRADGSGRQDDLVAVAAGLGRIAPAILEAMRQTGVQVVACRESVVDYATDLHHVIPRGWEAKPGEVQRYWNDVPGAYLPRTNEVVIATLQIGGQRRVPPKGFGHGAYDLVIHESIHGYDYTLGRRPSNVRAFRDARDTDHQALSPYEQQAGAAGREETYAESAARYFAGDTSMATDWPALHGFWRLFPEGHDLSDRADAPPEPFEAEDRPIGIATFTTAGLLVLDLTAEGPRGEIGHSRRVYTPGQSDFDAAVAAYYARDTADAMPGGSRLILPSARRR